MDNVLKGLIIAAGVILTCLIIGTSMYIGREANAAAINGIGQISTMNREFSESDKVMYDGTDVTGAEVVNVINKYKNQDISVKVATKKSTVYYNRLLTSSDTEIGAISTASVKDTQTITNLAYINQKAQYTGKVLRDSNETIIGISFTQK